MAEIPNLPLDLTFQPRRAWLFTVYQAAFQGTRGAITAGVLAGLYVFFALATLWGSGEVMEGLWGGAFLVVAWMAAAGAFADTRRAARASRWFLVPASLLEKYAVSTLVPLMVLVVGMPLLGWASDLVARLLSLLFWGRAHRAFDLFTPGYWWTAASALALVPVFFYGSVAFRKRPLLKTLLVLFAAALTLTAVLTGLGWAFLGGSTRSGLSINGGEVTWGDAPLNLDPGVLAWTFGTLYFVVVPLFFLVAGFLKLSEREVDDGVS